ncbi:MAG: glycosyltransferase family 2 protein [Gemmatimonadales bacterium]|nr:glycosyltransferase family 2 protein [Gemmatimonadales bacterium]
MKISGFTIVRNAEKLDFPVEASIRSILPICDEVVVNVGRSEDRTLDIVRGIADPKVRILETDWDFGRGEAVLREETLHAMRACRFPWGIGIQADEVLHEAGAPALRTAIERADSDPRVEGVVVRYRHIFGDPGHEAVNRRWYRREVRAVRLDPALGIEPYRDAQGFRVGPEQRRVRATLTQAEMFHYGWLRSGAALRARGEVDRALYPGRWVPPAAEAAVLRWFPGLRPFRGSHPAVARDWVAAHADDPSRLVTPPFFAWEQLRFYASDIVERLTGHRPFEFRNYTLV